MPSTRKQNATEKRSRHSDVMSDMKNLDVILGSCPENDLGNEQGNEQDKYSVSAGQQGNTDSSRKKFRSLRYSKS